MSNNIFPGRIIHSVNGLIGKVKLKILKTALFSTINPHILEFKDQDGELITSVPITTENVKDLTTLINSIEIHPKGLEGQLYFIDKNGTSDIIPDYIVKRGIIVTNQEEFDIASAAGISLEEVFNTWNLFSHYDNIAPFGGNAPDSVSPPNFPAFNEGDDIGTVLTEEEYYNNTAWGYDDVNDRIYLTSNYHAYTGFISPQEFSNFTFEATLSSADQDDDFMGLIIGFYTDPVTGYEYSLSVIRCMLAKDGQGDSSYMIVKNFSQTNAEIIVDATELAPYPAGATGGWNTVGPTRISVSRTNNLFQIKTSQFGSEIIDDLTLVEIDLNAHPTLDVFKNYSKVGFSAKSQRDAYFSDIVFSGLTNFIFFKKAIGYDTYFFNQLTQVYELESPQVTLTRNFFGKNRFINSYLFGKIFYITERDDILLISSNTSESTIEPTNRDLEIVEKDTSFTLTDNDHWKFFRVTGTTDITVTVSWGLMDNFRVVIKRAGTGRVILAGQTDVVLEIPEGFTSEISQQYDALEIKKEAETATQDFVGVYGALKPVEQ